jgi:hypothetical protein
VEIKDGDYSGLLNKWVAQSIEIRFLGGRGGLDLLDPTAAIAMLKMQNVLQRPMKM